MKIIKTKEITPKDVSEITDNILFDFKDRTKLHDCAEIPDFFVYIQDYAWNAFVSHGNNVYKETQCEAQGIFVGYYFKDQFGEFVVATTYEEGNGNSQSAYVEMSEECLAKISENCQRDNFLMLIWIHTHPGFGVFYSGTDYNCLKTNFYKPYQIGLVVDILKNQIKGFKTKGNEVVEYTDFALFNDENNLLYSPYENHKIKVVKKNDEKINELAVEIERLEKDLQSKTEENIELKKELQQKEDDLETVSQRNTELETLKSNLQNKEQASESLTNDLQQAAKEIEQLKSESQNKQEQIEALNKELQSKLEEIEQLKQNANAQRNTCWLFKIFCRKNTSE
ncbi:MAG: hypothetical protein LBC89_04635 [Bacteroidales bacterium]|jgi:proteasome lid subunit RPN8/RPN11|nr:hypothetical protein [Bacteroidales bacterium]